MTPGLRDDLRLDTEDPIMEEIRALPTYKLLDELSQQGPLVKGTLRQYGEFSEEVAQCFLERIAASGTSRWLPNTTVESLQLHDAADVGSPVQISAQTADGAHLSVSARSVLLATGGLPKMPSLSAHLNAKLRSSDYIQREVGMAEVEGILKAQGDVKIAVIGGSHSAFSGSQLLLNMLGDGVSVEILHRDVIRVYYDSVADAEAAGYEVNPASVCAISGQVNRYGGIRPPVRELYQDVLAGTEGRLRFVKCGVGQPTEAKFFDALERADLIVPAFGYTANLPPLKNAGGAIMDWALDPADGQALMNNSTSQLSVKAPQSSSLGERSSQLPNVFGAGLGFGLKAGGELKIGEQGVRIDGQAQYHSWVGVMNLNGMAKSTLLTVLAKPEEALLCAVLTHAWSAASLWSALYPRCRRRTRMGGSPSRHSPRRLPPAWEVALSSQLSDSRTRSLRTGISMATAAERARALGQAAGARRAERHRAAACALRSVGHGCRWARHRRRSEALLCRHGRRAHGDGDGCRLCRNRLGRRRYDQPGRAASARRALRADLPHAARGDAHAAGDRQGRRRSGGPCRVCHAVSLNCE